MMLVWKDTFPEVPKEDGEESSGPWDTWGRPPGGFLDFGSAILVFESLSQSLTVALDAGMGS